MNENRVWIAQCLCGPARHCIVAMSGEAASVSTATLGVLDTLRETVGMALRTGEINPWCSLCNAPAEGWQYELGRTKFKTMAEAKPALREQERQQALTRAAFGDMKGAKH